MNNDNNLKFAQRDYKLSGEQLSTPLRAHRFYELMAMRIKSLRSAMQLHT